MIYFNLLTPKGQLEPGRYTVYVTNTELLANDDVRITVEFKEQQQTKGWLRRLIRGRRRIVND